MIKIEQLTEGTKATIERTGAGKVNLYPNMLLTRSEFDTLCFTLGSITYSVDELEVTTITKDTSETVNKQNLASVATTGDVLTTSTGGTSDSATSINTSVPNTTASDSVVPAEEVIEAPTKVTTRKVGKTVK